jgi:hypothetical protein
MEQSTVLLLIGIIGNLVLVLLLVVAWRLLMGNRDPRGSGNFTPDEQYDDDWDESGYPLAAITGEIPNDQLAGLFRFDSWSATDAGSPERQDAMRRDTARHEGRRRAATRRDTPRRETRRSAARRNGRPTTTEG